MTLFRWDDQRQERTGVPEVVLCDGKSCEQIDDILRELHSKNEPVLLTRLRASSFAGLAEPNRVALKFHSESATAVLNADRLSDPIAKGLAIVAAGTSDRPVACEAQQTLRFLGVEAPLIADVGVAGLDRLLSQLDVLREQRLLIAVAGMEGALFSVLAGLVPAPVIAVPSPVGYGVSDGGQAALQSALASCAPGVVAVNIGNGFGAAMTAVKWLRVFADQE